MPVPPPQSSVSPRCDWLLLHLTGVLIAIYLTSNLMSAKLVRIWPFGCFDAGTILFPLAYMLGDVLTEIWGYRTARRVIWLTFLCNVIMTAGTALAAWLPGPQYSDAASAAYGTVFSYVPRIVLASLAAFLCGELSNAYYMVKIRQWTGGRWLWMRTIGSSIPGYLLDSAIFIVIAFAGTAPWRDLSVMFAVQFAMKMGMEVLLSTPMAYGLVAALRLKIPYPPGGE